MILAVLLLAGAAAILAVPDLRASAQRAISLKPGWLIGAGALELASCLSFVAIFRRFFPELPVRDAHRLAWIEMGSGALLPGGGIGSLVAGGVLLRRRGLSAHVIVERSSGLFFLTSATNVLALEAGALLLAVLPGRGPHEATLTAIPAAVGLAATAIVLALPRTRRHRRRGRGGLRSVIAGIAHAERELTHPHWRLLGAIGYLGFDIAVLGLTCAGLGHPIRVPALMLAYLIGYAANSLPVPGGIGVLEGGLVGALILYGAPAIPATGAVLLYHTIAFWIPSLGGAIAYLSTAVRGRPRKATTDARPCERRAHSTSAHRPEPARAGASRPAPESL